MNQYECKSYADYLNGARWLLARSDVEAAIKFLDLSKNGSWRKPLQNYMTKFWPQYFTEGAYAPVYAEAGMIEAQVRDVFQAVAGTLRFQIILQIMQQIGRPKKVLDFGCSRAYHAIHLHNLCGCEFTCVDIDETSINAANAAIHQHARNPNGMTAMVAQNCDMFVDQEYDAVICLETLEHVRDYQLLLAQFERCVKPGGWVVISVPHGPVEFTMWVESPARRREHIREFSVQDCYDLWQSKPGFYLQMFGSKINQYAQMPEGSIFIAYRTDDKPCGRVNMDRKVMGALAMNGPPLPGFDIANPKVI